MAAIEIRPTMRFIHLGYAAVAILLVASLVWWATSQDSRVLVAVAAAALLLLWPISKHIKRQRTCWKLENGQLRYESGVFSSTVKTIQLAKVQDVTVRRSFGQKMWGIGDLRIETAGQSSALEVSNVEKPQECADQIGREIEKLRS